ncbi:glycoside hydrolase family 99-like domain-containing protein [Vibrio echinoideorum]|uniref:glycosyltransferase WbsX family protein n=1 Tax=Vibrio echinoideorum TaxID=2100116 RepID=UPI0010811442|nr:glycoside hydrolase family 99-like domain-containing protein [Vibrio echinoideorum]
MNIYAIYFPQFYPIKENSEWWGKDFTDWELVKSAVPIFEGHIQPRKPKLGYLDQSLSDTIIKQVELAKDYGIDGFNFYHYWFNSTPYLDMPVENFLKSDIHSFDFFFTWANESWTRQWVGKPNEYLIKQNHYTSKKDIQDHYHYLSKFFKDIRYKKIENEPVYCIYRPELIRNLDEVIEEFNYLARKDGFSGVHFIAFRSYTTLDSSKLYKNFKAIVNFNPRYTNNTFEKRKQALFFDRLVRSLPEKIQSLLSILRIKLQKKKIFSYSSFLRGLEDSDVRFDSKPVYNTVFPDWDNTPRYGKRATLFKEVSSENFHSALKIASKKCETFDEKMIIINAWNEWSESAYLEPDDRYGYSNLEKVQSLKK